MKTKWILAAALAVSMTAWEGRAGILNNIALNVTLLPNTQYEVKAQVSINGVEALLNSLLNSGDNLIQIVDGNGNVLGELPVQDLVDTVTGLTGNVTQEVVMTLNSVTGTTTDVIAHVLDTPGLSAGNLTVTAVAEVKQPNAPNTRPTLKLAKRQVTGLLAKLRGTTTDDGAVMRVEVTINGKVQRARGTTSWIARPHLRAGKNRISIRAIDNAGNVSDPRRLTIVARG